MQGIEECQQGERLGHVSRTMTYIFVCSLSEEHFGHIYSSKGHIVECKEKLIFTEI